jgi:hypothetical protein
MTGGRAARETHAGDAVRSAQSDSKGFIALTTKMLAYPTEPKVRTPDQKLAACIAVICSFAAIGPLATNIFLPSLPAIAADLHITSATVAATISVFLAIFAVGQLIVGPLSDRFGRRIPILTGLCIFVVGTVWCALASDLQACWLPDRYRRAVHARLPYFHVRLHAICSMGRRLQKYWR